MKGYTKTSCSTAAIILGVKLHLLFAMYMHLQFVGLFKNLYISLHSKKLLLSILCERNICLITESIRYISKINLISNISLDSFCIYCQTLFRVLSAGVLSYFVHSGLHSGLQDESLQVTISKLPWGSLNSTGDEFPCTGGTQLTSRSEGRCTYLVSSLQMTLAKACSDTEIFLTASGDRTWDL